MPSIIPSPGSPGVAPNLFDPIQVGSDAFIAAGTTIYTTTAYFIYDGGTGGPYRLVNDGALWNVHAGVFNKGGVIRSYYFDTIVNNGLMVADAPSGDVVTLSGIFPQTEFTNNGRIFALAGDYAATIIDGSPGISAYSYSFENYGLIAARGGLGAVALTRYVNGELSNGATGSILAEGGEAVAVRVAPGYTSYFLPTHIDNAGRIEAASTNVAIPSIAIELRVNMLDAPILTNSGTIKGDFAIRAVDASGNMARTTETIVNQDSGLIEGDIFLGRGDDVILNAGRIDGDVDLFEGNDRFDNGSGLLVGVANLGWGNDTFIGGASADAVVGDRGDDVILGGGGADLLLGGRGNDRIEGGAGFDGLYGEAGDDLIRAGAGDKAFAGLGNDRVELEDYAFATVDGGAGFDTLVLPQTTRLLDLRAALANNRIVGFEKILLPGNQELLVRPGDLTSIGSDGELIVGATALGKVDLLGGWAEIGTRTIDGTLYRIFGVDGVRVLVETGATVAVVTTPPTGEGLDYAGPGEAPLAGSIPGASLAPSDTQSSGALLTASLTIDADESWTSTNGAPVLTVPYPTVPAPYFVNRGTVTSQGGTNGARALELQLAAGIENSGTISAVGVGNQDYMQARITQFALYGGRFLFQYFEDRVSALDAGSATAVSSGQISASSTYGVAIAVLGSNLTNSGTISASSAEFLGVGVSLSEGRFFNSGTISAQGGHGSFGIVAFPYETANISNSGLIAATTGTGGQAAVGIYVGQQNSGGGHGLIDNSGTIRATVAIRSDLGEGVNGLSIRNSGIIEGRIELDIGTGGFARNDVVDNKGQIIGEIQLGGGNDTYVGDVGVQQGDVRGGAGTDLLVGTNGADRLFGEADSDGLIGGAGADTLSGGGGRDVFVYRSAAESTTDAMDVITDFETGVDRLELSAIGATGFTLTAVNGATLLGATTANGTLTIRIEGSIAASDVNVGGVGTITGSAEGDFLSAAAGGSTVTGNAGADYLLGSAANDWLDGGLGNDIMRGGAGDDIYVADDHRDVVAELAGQGLDTVEYSGFSRFVLPDDVENGIALSGGGLIGNALANVLTGNRDLNYLDGGAGADVLRGGEGSDSYVVDNVGDVIVEDELFQQDWVTSSIDYALPDRVENLTLTGSATVGIGNAGQNWLTGAALDDTLVGGADDDRLDGLDGNDRLSGDEGADTIFGRAGSDRIFGGSGNDVIEGGDHDDWIEGGDGDDQIYSERYYTFSEGPDAAIGTDVLIGGGGADDFRLGDGPDKVVYLLFTDSTVAASDTISAFTSGEDKIDLSALGTLSLSWASEVQDGITFSIVTAAGNAGTLSLRVVGTVQRSDFLYQSTALTLAGTSGNDDLEGWNGNDQLFFQQGGADRVRGLEGNDGFYFGAALTGLDAVDGGTGSDTLAIQGNYPGLVLGGEIVNVEVLFLAPGNDTRFGDTTGNSYDYAITSVDANVAAGATLTVVGGNLRPGEDIVFNGAAETDGRFRIFAGQGTDQLTGGAGSDGFFFGADANLTGADRINGGAGTDSIALRGNYVGATAVLFQDASFSSVEVLTFLSGHTNEFGGVINSNGFDYDVALANGTIAAGSRLDVIAGNLRANESVRIDARGELDGTVRIIGGAGDDIMFGGAGNDILSGGLGADALDGSGGSDSYVYRATAESTATARDTIAFGTGDRIDLSLIDAVAGTSGNEAFSFIGAGAFTNVAGQLRVGQSGNQWIVEGDANGDGVADLVIAVAAGAPLTVGDFIL